MSCQARRLREESGKVAALESSLARMLQDFQEDRRRLTAVFAAERAEAQGDIRALRQLAKARGRTLHKVCSFCPQRAHSPHHDRSFCQYWVAGSEDARKN